VRHVRIEQEGRVAVVRIDRPPANAMDLELLADGYEALEQLRAAPPGAVVLVGRDRFFSGGVDLKLAPLLGPDEQREMVAGINRVFAGWYAFARPVVCAVNGHAIAGGLILALCGDVRVCATDGKLGLTELRAGVGYPAAAMAVVRAELTPPVARELVLRAELIDPEEALARGIVDELADREEVLPRAIAIAEHLAELPGATYQRVKEQLRAPALAELRPVVEEGSDPMLGGWLAGGETAEAAARILRGD
jgi:enoyl-CoA hydratase/carnithine racemase